VQLCILLTQVVHTYEGRKKKSKYYIHRVNIKNLQCKNTSHLVCFSVRLSCVIESTLPAELSILASRLLVSYTTKVILDSLAKECNIKYYATFFRTTRAFEKLCGVSCLNTGIKDLNSSQDMEFHIWGTM
jgi:hypothetical protein